MSVSKFIGSVELKTVSSLSSATSATLYCLSSHETEIVPLLRQENSATDFTVLIPCEQPSSITGTSWNYVSTNREINVRIILHDLISVVDYFWNSVNEQ